MTRVGVLGGVLRLVEWLVQGRGATPRGDGLAVVDDWRFWRRTVTITCMCVCVGERERVCVLERERVCVC